MCNLYAKGQILVVIEAKFRQLYGIKNDMEKNGKQGDEPFTVPFIHNQFMRKHKNEKNVQIRGFVPRILTSSLQNNPKTMPLYGGSH